MKTNLNVNVDVVELIKYIRSCRLYKNIHRKDYEREELKFIMSLNQMVQPEKDILITLLNNGNKPIQSIRNPYIDRLCCIKFLYVIPNSDYMLEEKRKDEEEKKAKENGVRILGSWMSESIKEYFFALEYKVYQYLKYLKDEGKIFAK